MRTFELPTSSRSSVFLNKGVVPRSPAPGHGHANLRVGGRASISRVIPRATEPASGDAIQNILDQASSFAGSISKGQPLEGMQPHWGARHALSTLESLSQQVAQQVPLEQVTRQLTQQGDSLLASVLASLPAVPAPAPLTSAAATFTSALSSVGATATSALSSAQASAVGFGASASQLSASTSALMPPSEGRLPSHFGVQALEHAVTGLSDWVLSKLSSVDGLDPSSLVDLRGALGQLQQASRLLATLPSMAATDMQSGTSSLVLSAEAAQAAIKAVVAQQAAAAAAAAGKVAPQAVHTLEGVMHQLSSALAVLQANGTIGGHSIALVSLLVAAVMAAVAATTPGKEYDGYTALLPYDDHVKLGHQYSAEEVAEYFRRRPLAVAQRAAQVAAEAAGFGAALLLDMWTGRLQANENDRARQLRGVIERLGPAYVKVAQAMSTRVDLLSPAYFEQIQLLQDRVPPFPCAVAMAAMEEAFGQPPSAVFASISERPVAAASLGQVYRATLKPELGGDEVAVKVLRPGVLEQVGLDLYIMRHAAVLFNETGRMNTDWAAVIDEWALRFFAEMDYAREARNGALLQQQMAPLAGVLIADVVPELSTADVLTTVWVDGEKLSDSRAADVRELCNTLLNAYLIQLLETGFLHADPHPGNLIRTPDGKICILDMGLMTEVSEAQRWALLEYIAHLSTEDWESLAMDLQVMGFIPPEINPKESGLVEPLGVIMSQLVGGGGAAKVNIDKVTEELTELGKKYPFQIPPFFALILRAFSVIEGIALGVDPDYAIVKECFPYLSRRLLQDDSPRAHAILRDILYGGKQRLDVERLNRLANGFGSFTTDGLQEQKRAALALPATTSTSIVPVASTSTSTSGSIALAAADSGLDPAVRDALIVMLGRRGSYVQELLVNEAVVAVDALSRGTLNALLQALLGSAPASLAASAVAAMGPLRGVILPVPTPYEMLSRLSPVLAATPEDQEALAVVQGIMLLLQKVPSTQVNLSQSLQRDLVPLLPELTPGLSYMAETFTRAFVRRIVQRLGGTLPLLQLDSSMAALGFMPLQRSQQQQQAAPQRFGAVLQQQPVQKGRQGKRL